MEKRNQMMKEYDMKIKRLRKERHDRLEHQEKLAKEAKKVQAEENVRREVLRF